jgi:glyoxylase-like metal-dependent hydrolase (beta-lactamase superfamily II)
MNPREKRLPGGSEPLLPLEWQPVPGCSGALVYPFVRKADTVSSNSYLVRMPDALVLIDPGGLPGQAAHLASVVHEARAEIARPLVVILTHAHVDHYLAALSAPVLTDPEIAIVAVQEYGAEALESTDRRLTQADILGREIAPMRIDLCLLTSAGRKDIGVPVRHTYANGSAVTVVREEPDAGLEHELIVFEGGSSLEVYHTPGHSPDSCCIRIGGLLFIGDLLFAASPGIAGISGWDQESLVRSLAGVQALISRGGIAAVCPGHGWTITADDGARLLGAVQRDASLLIGIAELDRERAQATAAFAEDCMDQVNELFTVMAGRLYYVSHVMDELGESDIAAGLHALIRSDAIDDLLDAFAAFATEYHSGRHVPLHLALKGGQVIGKIQRSFDQCELAQIIDPGLVQRAERLLGDYTAMLKGYSPPRDIAALDLCALLETCIMGHTVRACSDDDVLASADDDAAFGRLLLARIGTPPLLADVEVILDADTETPAVSVDRGRFLDLMTYLLEDLVGTGAAAIDVRVERAGEAVVVAVSGAWHGAPPAAGGKPRRFLYRLCEWTGGTLEFGGAARSREFKIRIPTGG